MNGTELRSLSHFQILTWIAYSDLSRNIQIDKFKSLPTFTVKLWKSVKMMKFKCKDDLQVFSWWMEKNWEDIVIIKFRPKSHTCILAEKLKIDWFWSFSSFNVKLWTSVKTIKFKCKDELQVFSWWMEKNQEVFSLSNYDIDRIPKWSNSNVKMIYKCFLDE